MLKIKMNPVIVAIDTESDIDWTGCELVKRIPGKVSGRPIVRGTRILPDAFLKVYAKTAVSL